MNKLRACIALCLLQFSTLAFAEDTAISVKPEQTVAAALSQGEHNLTSTSNSTQPSGMTSCCATQFSSGQCGTCSCGADQCCTCACGGDGCCDECCCSGCPGFFIGLGGSYNSVKVDQDITGAADSNVFSGQTLVAFGTAGGPAPPFHSTNSTFAPVAQLGYARHFGDSEWLWGTKFLYKYLGITFTNEDVISPQVGQFTTTGAAPTDTTFDGHAVAQSSQVSVNHELALMMFVGHAFHNGFVYLGAGPVVFGTESQINNVTGYADINGVHTDITGTPINFSSSAWMWGAGSQIGLIYYTSNSCFIDLSYDFMVTGENTQSYTSPFTSESSGFTTTGTLSIDTTDRVTAQSFTVSFNLMF